MPGIFRTGSGLGVPETPMPGQIVDFGRSPVVPTPPNKVLSGVTRDASSNPLGFCTVKLFNTATDVLSQQTTSDASGNYSFVCDGTQTWYIVTYLAGSPDLAGTTINTLTAT
jgi:hypothetical protein